METKLTPTNRLDLLDAEAFGNMLESASFRLFLARVQRQLARELTVTERADELMPIHRAQGAAAALRSVLALPEQIRGEIKAGVKKRRQGE
jgi:hypothetical protein